MRLTAVLLFLLLAACQSIPPVPDGSHHYGDYESHNVAAVNQVVPGVLEALDFTITRHVFDGGRGYVKAMSPSGAVTEVRWDWVFEDLSWVQVASPRGRVYRDKLVDRVLYEISVALNEPGK